MNPDDIAKALLDLYATAGFKNEDDVISNLKRLSTKDGIKLVPKEFITRAALVTLSAASQYDYLSANRDVVPEAKKIMYHTDDKPQTHKTTLLTSPKLKKDPELQVATAKVIRNLPCKRAEEFVRKVNKGEITHTPGSSHFQQRGKPYKVEKEAGEILTEGTFWSVGIDSAAKMIRVFTYQDKHGNAEYTQELIDNSRDKRLQWMKMMTVL